MTADEIKELIIEELDVSQSLLEDVSEDTSLVELGILDSLNTIKLITELERKTGIAVDWNDIFESNISTIRGLLEKFG